MKKPRNRIYFVYHVETDEILAVFNNRVGAIRWCLTRKNRSELDIYFSFINEPFRRRQLIFEHKLKRVPRLT